MALNRAAFQKFMTDVRKNNVAGVRAYCENNRDYPENINVITFTGNPLDTSIKSGSDDVTLFLLGFGLPTTYDAKYIVNLRKKIQAKNQKTSLSNIARETKLEIEEAKPANNKSISSNPSQERLNAINFTGEIPAFFKNPLPLIDITKIDNVSRLYEMINGKIMHDPITVKTGVTYEREFLKSYFQGLPNFESLPCLVKENASIARSELKNETNATIKNLIEEFIEQQEISYAMQISQNEIPEIKNQVESKEEKVSSQSNSINNVSVSTSSQALFAIQSQNRIANNAPPSYEEAMRSPEIKI